MFAPERFTGALPRSGDRRPPQVGARAPVESGFSMAYDIDEQHDTPLNRRLFFRFGGPRVVRKWRAGMRRVGASGVVGEVDEGLEDFVGEVFAVDWERAARDFRADGWAFLDPFLAAAFYARFRSNWPSKAYLEPPKKATKWYDVGYHWKSGWGGPVCLRRNAALDRLIRALGEPAFLDPLADAVGLRLDFFELHVTDSGGGAEVPMHLDSLLKGDQGRETVGIAIFVEGSGGPRSGGLAVSRSNSWDDVVFEPMNLNNTALLYSKRLHHGFRPIARGKYRRSINTRFRPARP